MPNRAHILILILLLSSFSTASSLFAQSLQITSGITYLTSSQNPDGTWESGTTLTETTNTTATVIESLKLLSQTSGSTYTNAVTWLQGQSPITVDYMAERVRVLGLTDNSVNALPPLTDPANGAWGGYDGYLVNPLDTALALQALKASNYPDLSVVNTALAYLTNTQNPDGGWGFSQGDDSNFFVTSTVSATLQQFPQTTAIAAALTKATAYLVSHQNLDGGFGVSPANAPSSTVYETALAYSALVGVSTDTGVLGNAVTYLTSTQSANGSWSEDPYSTALALKALYLSENKPAPPPAASTTGSVMGTIVDAATNTPLAGVKAELVGNSAFTAASNANGLFALSGIPAGSQQITLRLAGYAPLTITAAVNAGSFINVGKIGLSVNPTTGTVMGVVWDADENAPYSGVTVQAIPNGNLFDARQTVSGPDGSFKLTGVTPGNVTVGTPEGPKPGYWNVPMTGALAPGGVLIYNPRMSKTPPITLNMSVQTDKMIYQQGQNVALVITMTNTRGTSYTGSLNVKVSGPNNTGVYETSVPVNITQNGTTTHNLSFTLPASAINGFYTVSAEVFDPGEYKKGTASTTFNLFLSRIEVTPLLPDSIASGSNTISFKLNNAGTFAVSAGALAIHLKDPDGQSVFSGTQSFSLGRGESRTLAYLVSIPAMKFGAYTLTYTQSDETTAGLPTAVPLTNTVTVSPVFDKTSYRIRETANLLINLGNTGRFNLEAVTVNVAMPDAGYTETKSVSIGSGQTLALTSALSLPETMTAGQHNATITLTLPSGAAITQSAQLSLPESSLSMSLSRTAYNAGETISPVVTNSGGADTQVQYKLSLYDVRNALIAEKTATEAMAAGSSLPLNLTIPGGTVDGSYNLVVNYQDSKTGKSAITPNPITISGLKGSLQVQTDKQTYLATESITATSSITSSGTTPIQNANLHLQVTTAAGIEAQKTWTSRYDFQQGVREGVDTYGVNDWIIPDDDFSGQTLDTEKWDTYGDVSIKDGKLLTNCQGSSSAINSKWQLDGDFDIQVDFSNNNSIQYQGAELGVLIGDYDLMIKNDKQEGYFSGIHWRSNLSFVVSKATGGSLSASSGSFRIARTGTTITTYYKEGSDWIEHLRYTMTQLSDPGNVSLTMWAGQGYPTSAEFDNFKVNSGRIKTENQTVDSVRLLPVNDNFDDGQINTDRWLIQNLRKVNGITGPATAGRISEQNGKLLISYEGGSALDEWMEVYGKGEIRGDVEATVDWSDFSTDIENATGTNLLLNIDPDHSVYMKNCRANGGGSYARDALVNGTWSNFSIVPTNHSSGRLKITRSGSVVRTYYFDGAVGWVELGAPVEFSNGPARPTLNLWMGGDGNASGRFNNLKVKSITGEVKYVSKGIWKARHSAELMNSRWGSLLWQGDCPLGASIRFRTRTANTETDLASAAWSDYLTASGSAVTSPPGRWIEVEATLETTDTKITPLLHEVTVTYGNSAGDIIWQKDVPVSRVEDAGSILTNAVGTLGVTGKLFLQGALTSTTGQALASSEYPFYIEQGNIGLLLAPDKKIYKPGETVTISGDARNHSSVDATGLTLLVQGTGAGSGTLYTDAFDLSANGSRPFSFTTTAGADGAYGLRGTVTQNSTILANVSDQYETATPALTATLSAPDTAGIDPFSITVSLNNSGKVSATTTMRITDDKGQVIDDQTISIPAGETRVLHYTRQITGDTTYSVVFTGDLNQTRTRTVAYSATVAVISVTAKVVTDKISYDANNQVAITSTATNRSATASLENLTAWISIVNSRGQAVYSTTAVIPTLVPGQTTTINKYWNTADSPAGAYAVKLVVSNGGAIVNTSQAAFTITGSSRTGAGLTGTITAADGTIDFGTDETLTYTVANTGNEDLSGLTIRVSVIDPDTLQVVQSNSKTSALLQNSSATDTLTVPTSSLSFRTYLAVLQAGPAEAGEPKTLASATFTVRDNIPPVLTVSTLADTSVTNNAVLNVTGTATDNQGMKEVTVNGVAVPLNSDGGFSYALALTNGANQVVVTAVDQAGNQAGDSRTINLDQAAPQLVITAPADNSKVGAALLTITGTVDESSTVAVKLGDTVRNAVLDGTNFSADVALVPGTNTIEVTATDLAGNTSAQKRTILYDDQAPSLSVTVPAQDIRTNQATLLLKGTATDPYTGVTVSVSADGQTFAPQVADGQFEQPVEFTAEKSYAIVVTATNEVGRSTTIQRNVIYDITLPPLTIDPVTTPTTLTEQVVTGTRESGLTVTITCPTAAVGEVSYPADTAWSASLSALQPGDNVVTVTTTDAAGNVAIASATITVDQTGRPLFSYAVFGDKGVTLSGGSYVDSYDGAGRTMHGNVGTNSVQLCGIRLNGGTRIYGTALTGVGGSPSTGVCQTPGTGISGGVSTLTSAREMKPVADPGGGVSSGALKLSGASARTLTGGDYRFSSISLTGSGKLTLSGRITLHVDGDISLSGAAGITITRGSSVVIYANGRKLNISGGAIANAGQDPSSLIIYGSSTLTTINLSGGTTLHALVYAPAATIRISGGQQTFGSINGSVVDLSGGTSVHYPEGMTM